ncbi:hypothetical protein DENIS_0707 [Desulfonema ishimotonii]|uniref:PTS EIIA type-2 domain-containing protein n=1 Tax=Desulfonema ishimotonii TaxID=45657 RepID=A0A401FS29_9BACT|nr:PTS sugar transporter subunit IIA [Desulfonema ishimotonii]GBC59766.1 hypothetical protein DENIS_0707 [Desulfonema ishimotonii]
MKLTINEVAQCLDLRLSTVERWVRQGRIPIQKSGDRYIFKRASLEKWAGTHNLLFSFPLKKEAVQPDAPAADTLLGAMTRGGMYADVRGDDVETLLKSAVGQITSLSDAVRAKLSDRLLQREQLTSTGIGKGIAIPHPRTPLGEEIAEPLIATVFPATPLDFRAVDNQPVFVLFILVSPSPKQHLHLLSRLSFCVRDDHFIDFLKSRPAPDSFLLKIGEAEARIDRKGRR